MTTPEPAYWTVEESAMQRIKRSPRQLTEDEKVRCLRRVEELGDISLLDSFLARFSELSVSTSEATRALYKRWKDVAAEGSLIEAQWGDGALLQLDDPFNLECRAKGLLAERRICAAEAYARASASIEAV